jgi:hypothetical protein
MQACSAVHTVKGKPNQVFDTIQVIHLSSFFNLSADNGFDPSNDPVRASQ